MELLPTGYIVARSDSFGCTDSGDALHPKAIAVETIGRVTSMNPGKSRSAHFSYYMYRESSEADSWLGRACLTVLLFLSLLCRQQMELVQMR